MRAPPIAPSTPTTLTKRSAVAVHDGEAGAAAGARTEGDWQLSQSGLRAALACVMLVFVLVVAKAFMSINPMPTMSEAKPRPNGQPDISLLPPSNPGDVVPKSLLRIRKRGSLLADFTKWKPEWNILTLSPHWEYFVFSRLASASDDVCALNAATSKIVISPFDLGSNVLNIIYNMLVAAYHNQSYIFVSQADRHFPNATSNVWQRPNLLAGLVDSHLALFQEGDTLCPSFKQSCLGKMKQCIGVSPTLALPPVLKHVDVEVLDALKTSLAREILRLKPSIKVLVDGKCAMVGCPDSKVDDGLNVALHVQWPAHWKSSARTSSSRNIALSVFVTAALKRVKDRPVRKVFIVTNDKQAPALLEREWARRTSVSGQTRTYFVSRVTPALLSAESAVSSRDGAAMAFVDELVDLRLLVTADLLVSQASNRMGELAFYLRGGAGVMNVEQAPSFKWK